MVRLHRQKDWTDERTHTQRYANEDSYMETRPSISQHSDKASRIENASRQSGYTHYAFVGVDVLGQIERFTSPSLKAFENAIFPPQLNDEILGALARTSRDVGNHQAYDGQGGFHVRNDVSDNTPYDHRHPHSTDLSGNNSRQRYPQNESSNDPDGLTGRRKRPRGQQYLQNFSGAGGNNNPSPIVQRKILKLCDQDEILRFYTQRFKDVQQSACKIIAKVFVKICEPKKQTNYPYTGGYYKAPKWWPLPPTDSKQPPKDGVRHKEPDHLLKPERVRLMVHILELVTDENAEKPETMRHITVRMLEEATNEAMAAFYVEKDHPENIKKKPFLNEIFKVAKQHERYKKGELDDSATIPVQHGDNLGGNSDEELDEGLQYEQEEEDVSHEMTPTSSMATPPNTMVSPMNSTHQSILSDPRNQPFYNNLAVRGGPNYQSLPTPTEDNPTYDQYRGQHQPIYQSQTPVFSQSQERRGSGYSIAPNSGYVAVPTTPMLSWQQSSPQSIIPPAQQQPYYTNNVPASPHHQQSAYHLPPPTSNVQQPQSHNFQSHVYEPLPPQNIQRVNGLPATADHQMSGQGYSEYLSDSTYNHGPDLKHEMH